MTGTEGKAKREQVRERLLARMPRGGVAAEIGVWQGQFSERILALTEPRELHLIDPWLYQPEFGNTGFGRKKNEHAMQAMFEAVSARFASDPRVTVHRATSEAALAAFPDAHFDWVYVDGNHNEPFIGNDLALCRRKVKPGGIIAGDDFNWQAEACGAPVRRAVEALLAELGPAATLTRIANQWLLRLPAAPRDSGSPDAAPGAIVGSAAGTRRITKERPMNKRDELIAKYAEALRTKAKVEPDMALLTKVTIGLGPSIYDADSGTIAGSDRSELERVRDRFLIGKLGLPDGPELMAAIDAAIDRYGRSDRAKYRAAIYYLLVRHFGKEAVYA